MNGVLAAVKVKAQLTDRRQATTRRKSSRLDTIFQIGNDLFVLALFLHSRPPLILLHCTLFFPSWQCLERFSRSHLGANVVYLGVRFIE
ncbi:Uncharacterised protein [Streptococcus pneumoniae]|nr:Uncharacterised protein [Streptococcus pneumoniae]